MKANCTLRNLMSALFISISFYVNAQQDRFIAGVLFDLNGIGILGNSGQFWNSANTKEGAGHGGFSCGLFVKREFTKKIYSSFEIRYSTKGSIYEYTNQYGSKSYESLHLNYVEFPILIGYKTKPKNKTYYFESGFEFSKLISSKVEAGNFFYRIGTPNTEGFRSIDLLWIGCLKFPLIKKWDKHFLFGIRVCRSVLPIHKYYKIYNLEYGLEFNYMFR